MCNTSTWERQSNSLHDDTMPPSSTKLLSSAQYFYLFYDSFFIHCRSLQLRKRSLNESIVSIAVFARKIKQTTEQMPRQSVKRILIEHIYFWSHSSHLRSFAQLTKTNLLNFQWNFVSHNELFPLNFIFKSVQTHKSKEKWFLLLGKLIFEY